MGVKRDLEALLAEVEKNPGQVKGWNFDLYTELKIRNAIAWESIATNTEYIAMGLAKIVERCFCGHRLDEHPESAACSVDGCNVGGNKCQYFVPVHLAMARMQSVIATELQQLRKIMSQPMGSDLTKLFH